MSKCRQPETHSAREKQRKEAIKNRSEENKGREKKRRKQE
jgi:hypothetical protein